MKPVNRGKRCTSLPTSIRRTTFVPTRRYCEVFCNVSRTARNQVRHWAGVWYYSQSPWILRIRRIHTELSFQYQDSNDRNHVIWIVLIGRRCNYPTVVRCCWMIYWCLKASMLMLCSLRILDMLIDGLLSIRCREWILTECLCHNIKPRGLFLLTVDVSGAPKSTMLKISAKVFFLGFHLNQFRIAHLLRK